MGTEDATKPIIDTKGKEIEQIGIVVYDAAKTAKRYSEIFGIGPWFFLDITPTEIILHDKPVADVESCVRIAMTNLGKIQIELLQPLNGPSTHMEFLREHGEGIHHVSFGMVDNHDQVVSAFKEQGTGIEMQGLLGGAVTFSYMSTQMELGTIFEVVRPIPPGVQSSLKSWGTFEPQKPGLVNLEGKEIRQFGIVVKDAEKAAKNFWDIFGIGPWVLIDFKHPHVSDGILHGISVSDTDIHIKAALAEYGNIQFELLQPVYGASTHMDFLRTRGEGVHHVSFGEVDDHDEVVSLLTDQGIGVESTGLLGGGAITFTYMATQKDLGTIFELVKVHPGVENTIVPYGTYPPSQ